MVLGVGNDPTSEPYQDSANPSQLPECCVVHLAGLEPVILAVKEQCPNL